MNNQEIIKHCLEYCKRKMNYELVAKGICIENIDKVLEEMLDEPIECNIKDCIYICRDRICEKQEKSKPKEEKKLHPLTHKIALVLQPNNSIKEIDKVVREYLQQIERE